ncbi:PepSY-associated TM helix domain-containing protein [Brevibacillus sp. B_LB10_24]|uniref:PepSY-associated TM helix domain-containing protein n=1 Tax=Brevibacillus sp. B_LB10_24 TaxID=3380645 RepID=UPI0038B8F9D5
MNAQAETARERDYQKGLYLAVWRWHFYAGVIFAPFLIFLSVTGAVYLFKPQWESFMYRELTHVQEMKDEMAASEQIGKVSEAYPDAKIISYRPSSAPGRTAEVEITRGGKAITVFVNPYSGKVIGELANDETFMERMKNLHNGMLWGGVIANRWVELTACWGVILIITGVFLWWPREHKSLFGTLIPRFRKGRRILLRDLHAVTAFWLSLFIVIQLFSGLMWTDVWGSMAHRVVDATGTGEPVGDQPWEAYAFPKSTIPTKEVADVPWAAENLPVPRSEAAGAAIISVEKVMQIAQDKQIHPGYKIAFPQAETGVYTVYLDPAEVYPNRPAPQTQQTLHIDQYSGKVLADFGWKDYGFMGKLISLGIAFHQGEFGFLSQLFGLVICLGIIGIAAGGLVMWWQRKPSGRLGAPAIPKNMKRVKSVGVIVIALGFFFPLVGLSIVVVALFDLLIVRRVPRVKRMLNA